MQALQLKLKYLQNELEYIEHIMPYYDKKFMERLNQLGKTHQISTNSPCNELESATKIHKNSIKELYRKLSLKYHPDRSKEPNCDELIRFINDCYSNNDEESLYILDSSDEYNENPEYLIKIKDITDKINNYKIRYSYLWNSGGKEYIESLYCTSDEFIKYENDMKEKLIKEQQKLERENDKLQEVVIFVENVKNEIEYNSIKFEIENIDYYKAQCTEYYMKMIDMKNKSKSEIECLTFEKELDEINKADLRSMTINDLQNYTTRLTSIYEYFDKMYWMYMRSQYKNRKIICENK